MTILGVRPFMGATALALSVLTDVAIKQKKRCLYLTLDNGEFDIMKRFIHIVGKIPYNTSRNSQENKWNEDQIRCIQDTTNSICNSRVVIQHLPCSPAFEVYDKCKRAYEQGGGLDFVIIDYFQAIAYSEDFFAQYVALQNIKKNSHRIKGAVIIVISPGNCS